MTGVARCRSCASTALSPVLDLGHQPLAEWFPTADELVADEPRWPLFVVVCTACWLVQLDGRAAPDPPTLAADPFAVSETMRSHARALVEDIIAVAGPTPHDLVVEVASHGGHIHSFLRERGVDVTLLEPDRDLGARLEADGTPTLIARLERDAGLVVERLGRPADVLVDAFMLAHVPDPEAFLVGAAAVLAPRGTLVLEFDHLLPLVTSARFDSFRHGHFTYLSLTALRGSLERHGLEVVRASRQNVYGGVLRVFARRMGEGWTADPSVDEIVSAEREAGLESLLGYASLATRAGERRDGLRAVLADARRAGRTVAGYGAPSRANTLLNFAGLDRDDIAYTVDASTEKQGRFLPGSRLPIHHPGRIAETRPDYVLILPWDLRAEIQRDLAFIAAWNGKFIIPLPELTVVDA